MAKKEESIDLTPEQYELLKLNLSESNLSEDNKQIMLECLDFCAAYGQKLLEKEAKIKALQNTLAKPSEKRKPDNTSDKDKETDQAEANKDSNQKNDGHNDSSSTSEAEVGSDDTEDQPESKEDKKRNGGNGRTSEAEYDAEDVYINHESLKAGDPCPEECGGTLYKLKGVGKFIRIIGQPLAKATRYHIEHLRCSLCGEVYKADIPKDVPANKYDERFVALLMLHKYYLAVPFNRQKDLQDYMGVPLAASTQWGIIKTQEDWITPLFSALENYASHGYSFVMDDTRMTIQTQKIANNKAELKKDKKSTYLTGIISDVQDVYKPEETHRVYLYKCGTKTAGRHLEETWAYRPKCLAPPLIMCDGLIANVPPGIDETEYISCNCLTHGRRQFIDLEKFYPKFVKPVIKHIGMVYYNDKKAKSLSATDRLAYHQEHSTAAMDALKDHLTTYVDNKSYEPNSKPMKAINYILKRWEELTVFLREPHALLDSNSIEQGLKLAIRIRKNAMFFKTEKSAKLSCDILSIFYTAAQAGINPADYLTALIEHREYVMANPEDWLPWEYQETLSLVEKSLQELAS